MDQSQNRPGPSEKWVKCIKILREPTEGDRAAFVAGKSSLDIKRKAGHSGDGDEDSDADAEDEDDLDKLDAVDELDALDDDKIPVQWDPNQHYSQFLFRLIESKGIEGCSSMVSLSENHKLSCHANSLGT